MTNAYGEPAPLPGRALLRRQAILLQYGVVLYNAFECVIALVIGHQINSIALFRVARLERDLAAGLNSAALHAESRETRVCAWLSAALLLGLGANFVLGLWWVDPAIAMGMAVYIAREGLEAFSTQELVHDHG